MSDHIIGEITSVSQAPLITAASIVVCLGAPKTGLLEASPTIDSEWQVFIADIGIGNAAWRKFGTRRRHGIEFGVSWVVEVKYQAGIV